MQQLESERATLSKRRDGLQREIDAARQDLEAAQADLIDGKTGAGERAASLQAHLTAHKGALRTLEHRLEDTEARLEKARQEAARERKEEELLRLAAAAKDALKENEAARLTLREAFEKARGIIIEVGRRQQEAVQQFRRLYSNEISFDELARRGGDLSAILTLWGEGAPRYVRRQELDLGRYAGIVGKAIYEAGALEAAEARRLQMKGDPSHDAD